MRAAKHRKRESPRKCRDRTRLSNVLATILTAVSLAVVIAVVVVNTVRQERSVKEGDNWASSIPWDPSWPVLAISNGATDLPVDVARAIYAFAGQNADVVQYIPCYCGCQSQGHRSNADCYVKRRSADGRVTEWDNHGLTCRVGPDITGDVMLWHEKGRPLLTIRNDIDHEYGWRGLATPTPRPQGVERHP